MRKPRRGLAKTQLRSSMAAVPTAILAPSVAAFVDPPPWPLLNKQHQLQQQHLHQAVPFYWYPSSYVAPNMTFNQKFGYAGGTYMNGYYAQQQPQYYHQHHMYGGGRVMFGASPIMPLYTTVYHYHQSQAIGFPQPSFGIEFSQ